jgi:protein involved in polysaccharide export with SLBB domain
VDFADRTVSESFLSRHPDARVVLESGNWYLALADTLGWPANFVTMDFRGRRSTVSGAGSVVLPVVGAVFVAGAAGFAYWAWRRSR